MVPLSIILFGLFFVLGRPNPIEQESEVAMANKDPLSSHVLDTASGRPAANLKVVLFKQDGNGGNWRQMAEQHTDSDGRVREIISSEAFTKGIYKLYFDTASYYRSRGEKTFYPFIEIIFEIEKPEEHYHVPILLSSYGYTTYRGS